MCIASVFIVCAVSFMYWVSVMVIVVKMDDCSNQMRLPVKLDNISLV